MIKRSVVPAKTRTSSDLAELEKQIRQQNDEYYEIYDLLEEKLSKDDQIEILNANLQIIPDTQYQVSNIRILSNKSIYWNDSNRFLFFLVIFLRFFII